MKEGPVIVRLGTTTNDYKITIKRDWLMNAGVWTRKSLTMPVQARAGFDDQTRKCLVKKIVLFSNKKVFDLYGEAIKDNLENVDFEVFVWLMEDGETHKNLRSLENALKFFSENKLARTDAVVALGGGVVGDLAGFAAAIYLRGIAYLQIPTTLLAMIDSSVGGKTAVNSNFGKNLIGAFHHPKGVLIDVETLKTLPEREIAAGFFEAVKQGVIGNKPLFNQTAQFLKKYSPNNFENYFSDPYLWRKLEDLITAQVSFKTEIVSGDRAESSVRTDAKSRKILNFGHTVGHALEKVTNYEYFKHGEAVAYGMLAAGEIAKNIGILEKNELKSLNDVVGLVGKLPSTDNIGIKDVIEAFEFDKKSTGKSLQWILLKKIGRPVIVEGEKIPPKILLKSLTTVLKTK